MNAFNSLWCEKYRPKTLSELVLNPETLAKLGEFDKKKEIPHLLFVSSPGTGKTSTAKIIVKEVLDCDYLYINASDEAGIDTIRSKVVQFAMTKSSDGKMKVIICDEADGISIEGMRALRNVMEEYASNTRFILTANYKHKIIPAIQSRCQTLDFNYPLNSAVKHILGILTKERVQISKEQLPDIINLVKDNYPDLRKAINDIQFNVFNGKLVLNKSGVDNSFVGELLSMVNSNKINEIRSFILNRELAFNRDYTLLLKNILDFVYKMNLDQNKKREMILVLSEYIYRQAFVIDQEINCYACMLTLSKILN
jgi:DNA polymerase III delta prime subunit